MPSAIERLHALQQLDTALRRLRRELDELAEAAAAARAAVDQKRPVVVARRHEMAELERRRREIEDRLAQDEERMKERRMRMQRIRNEKELAALRREIEVTKEQDAALEDELLRILEVGEARAGELEALEEELARLERDLAEREAAHAERRRALEGEISRRVAEREALAAELDESLRRRYELIFERKNGLAVVEVLPGDLCAGCRVRIPPQLVTEVHRNEVVFCPSCQRILCHPAVEAPKPSA